MVGPTASKKGCKEDGSTAPSGCEQASPLMVATGSVAGGGSPNSELTLYKITIRNPPFHTVNLGGAYVTVWGVKVQAPWNVPNSDGFDVHGTDITIYDTTVANGDQDIAFTSDTDPTSYITVDHFRAYSKGGIALLGDGVGITDLLIQNTLITGDLPSVAGTTVNGLPQRVMKKKYGLQSYGQALPNATGDLHALQVNSNLNGTSETKPGSAFTAVTFKSICIQDIGIPIHVGPVVAFTPPRSPSELPTVSGITFQDIHVLAPTSQFPELTKGIPTPSALGSYSVILEAYPEANFLNYLTFDNVVFDDDEVGGTSLSSITAIGNVLTTQTNVYPSILNGLQAPFVANPQPKNGVTLSANSYTSKTPVSSPSQASACPPGPWPYTTGELYASTEKGSTTRGATNLTSASVTAGSSITLNAVVQPIMSQTTQFMPDSYGADPGLLAVGSPPLTNEVIFYEGSPAIGFGTLRANRTLATFVVENVQSGTHTYTAEYPADRFYETLRFGSVSVQAR
jgi:hypothetical protein